MVNLDLFWSSLNDDLCVGRFTSSHSSLWFSQQQKLFCLFVDERFGGLSTNICYFPTFICFVTTKKQHHHQQQQRNIKH